MPAELRRVAADDWPDLRTLRLEALADCPVAFCERLPDAEAAPDSNWRQRAVRGAAGGDRVQVMAWVDGRPAATAGGFLDNGDAVLFGVYVTPSLRGQGLLAQLVDSVAQWGAAQGAGRLRLLVHETNGRAAAAYARLGFSCTGHREPYPLLPATDEVEMARPL